MHDLLAAIVAGASATVEARRRVEPLDQLADRSAAKSPRGDTFRTRLGRGPTPRIIAECKRRSPARGILARDYDPAARAAAYEAGGAAAVSVLTEPCFFDGGLVHLEAVRAAVDIPVLRKDFIVDEYQLHEARAAGADAILLIVAALEQCRLDALTRDATRLGLAALVEVHTRDEASRAVDAGAMVIGVNSRNLKTLEVDIRLFDDVRETIPYGTVAVAESGLRSAADVGRLHGLGYDAFLIGEWLMRAPDPAALVRELTWEAGA